ncbi:MAG: hypothetical protein FWB71_04800 [Defluviitaleaceae bacterium]|nr:hypothetical protein [Defluviitaleaceae bacterium]
MPIFTKFVAGILILVAISFGFAGCGSAGEGGNGENLDFARYFNDRSLFVGETLTITIPFDSNVPFVRGIFNRRNIETLARRYMRENPGVYIVVRGLGTDDISTMRDAQALELMAGSG